VGRDNSVDMATRCGLDGPVTESRWRARFFRTCPDRSWGPPSLVYKGYHVFAGSKAARWPPTPSSAEIKERVELCLYSPSGPSWPVLGWNLPLPLPLPLPHYQPAHRWSDVICCNTDTICLPGDESKNTNIVVIFNTYFDEIRVLW
jgi:hypothetical protein